MEIVLIKPNLKKKREVNMKKICIMGIVMLVIALILPMMNAERIVMNKNSGIEYHNFSSDKSSVNNPELVIDQQNKGGIQFSYGVTGTYIIAQSFTPTLETLSKVELLLFAENQYGYDLSISIRSDLNSNDLTTVSVSDENFKSYRSWIEFDFTDIQVNPGERYYIVWQYHEFFARPPVFWCVNDQLFPSEQAYIFEGSEWDEFTYESYQDCDFLFRTYGYDERPNIPSIDGPEIGKAKMNHVYIFSTIDPEGHKLFYKIDWGDDTNTDWIGEYISGETGESFHAWTEEGVYSLKVKAKDEYGLESSWSEPFTVTISGINQPPNKPDTPSGKTNGKADVEYSYSTFTNDPEGHSIYYMWDWGDGNQSEWLGPYNTGETCEAIHMWEEQDDYEIRVKAKDEHGKESEWSDPLEVAMPHIHDFNPIVWLIEQLIQRFPFLEPYLEIVLN